MPLEPATPAHAAALALLHAQAFPPPERWGAGAMALQLGLPGAFGWLSQAGGMILARVVADEAEVLTLAVDPARRRLGLGRHLLREAMRSAAARGAGTMFLEVAEGNRAARALYGAAGFTQAGRRSRYYPGGGDALVLRAHLPCGLAEP